MSNVPLNYAALSTAPRTRRWRGIFLVQGIQSCLIVAAGIVLTIFEPRGALTFLGGALAACVFVAGLQILYLLPITEPQINRMNRKSISRCPAAGLAGLLFGILAFGLVGLLGDLVYFQFVDRT